MAKPIALAADHGGFELKEAVRAHLEAAGIPTIDFGTHSTDSVDYPDMAVPACEAVVSGQCDKALLFCGTGVGISMAANKIKGIRPQRRQRPVHGRAGGRPRPCLPAGGPVPGHPLRGGPPQPPH